VRREPTRAPPRPSLRRLVVAASLLSAASCDGALALIEPSAAEVRVLVLAPRDGEPTVVALADDAAFRATLQAGDVGEVWLFQYSRATLAAEYPVLRGLDAAAVAQRLAPRFVDVGLVAPEEPPLPDAVLQATVSDGEASDYTPSTWAQWQTRAQTPPLRPFALALGRGDGTCNQVDVQGWSGPEDVWLEAIAPLDDDEAYAAGFTDDAQPTTVLRLGAGGPVKVATPADLVGRVRSLAAAGGGVVYGLADQARPGRGRLFALDARGAERPTPPIEGGGLRSVVRGSVDGTVIVSQDQGVLELSRGSTTARPRPDFVLVPELLHVVRHDRMLAVDRRGLLYGDGQQWRLEHTFGIVFGLLEAPLALGGDDELLTVTGEGGLVLVRDEVGGTWRRLPDLPLGALLLWSSVSLGGGEVLVAGARGYVAVWTHGRWCQLDTGTRLPFFAAARTPGSRVVWVVGADDRLVSGDRSVVLRVAVP
jgi:hypothetical protein